MDSAWKPWLKGLVAAAISGAATFISGMALDPSAWHLCWKLALIDGVKGAAAYLKQSPFPCAKCEKEGEK